MSEVPVMVTMKLRNAVMIQARERLGYSQATLAEIAGVGVGLIGRLEKFDLTEAFLLYHGDHKFATVAECLHLEPDDIVPPGLVGHRIRHTVRAVGNVETDKLLTMAGPQERYVLPSPADVMEKTEEADILRSVIKTLPFRCREVLKFKHGLDGEQPLTYSEAGRRFGVSSERVRQIELKAETMLANRLQRKADDDKRNDAARRETTLNEEIWESGQESA